MLQLKDHILTQPDAGLDTTAYVALAERVLRGDVALGPGLYFVSPLYIYFLAGVLSFWHSFTVVRLVQIVLGTASVGFVFVAGREWFGRRAAWLAAALSAFTGVFTFYESLLLQTSLDPLLTTAGLGCLALALRRDRARWYVLSGFAFGVQAMNRPNVMLPACAMAFFLVLSRRRSAGLFAVSLAIALAPVTIRNIVVAHTWSPMPSHGGLNFYIGNNAGADGTYRVVPGVRANLEGQQEDARRVAESAAGHSLSDSEVSNVFYRRGWDWIREQPAAAAMLFVRKLSLVFSGRFVWLNYSYPFFANEAGTLLRVLIIGPWLLIPLGVLGLVLAAPGKAIGRWNGYLIWASFVPLYGIAVAMFFVADRYTVPLLAALCAPAGASLDVVIEAVSERRWKTLAVAGAALAILFSVVNRPLSIDSGVAEERTRMAERLVTLGRYDEAEQWIARAEPISSRPGVLHFRIGQRLLARDQLRAAVAHFERALQFDPGQAEVEYALGEALLASERPQESAAHLRRAIDAGVHVDAARDDLVRALGAAGDRDGALAVLRQIQPSREHDGARQAALGELAMQLRDAELAVQFFRAAIAVRPELAAAHFGLAAADATLGRTADARAELQETLRLDPTSERARQLQRLLR